MIFIEGKLCNSSIISIEEFFSNLSLVNVIFFKLCEVNLDVLFDDGIQNPKDIEMSINNIPGVLENGLFVDLADKVLVGKIEKNEPIVYSPSKVS